MCDKAKLCVILNFTERWVWLEKFESALNMICFPKYIWSINFFFHFVKTSRFPWNLEHKKGDLKFSLLYMLHVNFSKISLLNGIRTPPPPFATLQGGLQHQSSLRQHLLNLSFCATFSWQIINVVWRKAQTFHLMQRRHLLKGYSSHHLNLKEHP